MLRILFYNDFICNVEKVYKDLDLNTVWNMDMSYGHSYVDG